MSASGCVVLGASASGATEVVTPVSAPAAAVVSAYASELELVPLLFVSPALPSASSRASPKVSSRISSPSLRAP